MARLQTTDVLMSFEEFLDWERHQELRHEFVDGVPVAMAGGTEAHNVIQGNVFAAALAKLRGSPCRPFPSDMMVMTGTGQGRYPDVTVDCGRRDPGNLVLPQPTVVVEVLSPETQRLDRTIKLAEYNATPSIRHYVLIEPSEPLVNIYDRHHGGDFNLRPREVRGLDGMIELPTVPLTLAMDEVYEGLEFGPAPEAKASGIARASS